MTKPLIGIKIIDLTRVLSGPFATMMLADLGAEVIKVESPEGDDTRQVGPPYHNGWSAYFLSINRNKKSMVLNLKTKKGKEIFFKLIKDADVVVENFSPGTLDRLGIGYDVLKSHNPQIILASISGFGQSGRYAHKPGYDVLAQAMGGLMSVTGERDGPPLKAGFSFADIGSGMWIAFGIMVALWERNQSGIGQWVETSLLDTIVSWQTYLANNYFASGEDPKPLGGEHPNLVPYQIFQASDGYFVIGVGTDKMWERLTNALDYKPLKNEKFKMNKGRVIHRDEVISHLQSIFIQKPKQEWIELMESLRIPSGPVNTVSEILNDPHIKEREMVVEKEHPDIGTLKMLGIPIKFSRTNGSIEEVPPRLGEHTELILSQLGFSEKEIQSLEEEGVTLKTNLQFK